MSENSTVCHSFIGIPPPPREMKRGGSPDGEPFGKPAKRAKSSKACHTCRQQKTRCEPGVATSGRSLRCSRCTRFNVECSFERSPPPMVMPQSFSTSPPNNSAPSRDRAEFPPDSGSTVPLTASVPKPTPSCGSFSSPSLAGRPQSVYEQQLYTHRHPITPTSPPRSNLDLEEKQAPMDMATTTRHTWSRNNTNAVAEQWAAPLSFTRELIEGGSNGSRPKYEPTMGDDLVTRRVLSPNEAETLTQIWKHRFAPWLPIEQAYSRMSAASTEASMGVDHRKGRNTLACSAFLQAVQWTLAAHHLPPQTSTIATPLGASSAESPLLVRLVQALQQGLTRASLGLDLSLSALRALLILATWSSTLCEILKRSVSSDKPEADDEIRAYDGEMLISTAVHIATQMHLELDVEAALSQVKTHRRRKTVVPELDPELLDRARTMFAVSAANTMLNLGKGRLCASAIHLEHAEQIFGSPSVLANRPGGDGDACVVYQCNLLVIALRVADRCTDDVVRGIGADVWTQRTKEDLQALDHLQQTLATTSALTSPNEIIPITVVIMQSHFLKINAIFRAFRTLFHTFPEFRGISASFRKPEDISGYMPPLVPGDPYDHKEHVAPRGRYWNGRTDEFTAGPTEHHMAVKLLVQEWGTKSKESSESLMATSLVLHRPHTQCSTVAETNCYPIAYAPDYTLFSILFGASYAVKVHTMIIFLYHEVHSGTEITRSILDRIFAMFREASPSFESSTSTTPPTGGPRHPLAYRCANALSALIKLWDARMKEMLANVPTTNSDRESSSGGSPKCRTPTPANGEPRDPGPSKSPPIASLSSYRNDTVAPPGSPSPTALPSPYPVSHTRSGNDLATRPDYRTPPAVRHFSGSAAQQQQVGAPQTMYYGVQGELFGLSPNFDIAPFYDPTFFFGGVGDVAFSSAQWPA